MTRKGVIYDHMTALGEGVRGRILLLLEDRELTVSELCDVVQLPQSTTSRHLKILGDDRWVTSRRNGTSRLYRMTSEELTAEARQLWDLVRGQVSEEAARSRDAERLEAVLARRRLGSRRFFSAAAGDWDRLRDELFGQRFYLVGLLGLLDYAWEVGDLGCGTGRVTETIAPFVRQVIAVDDSESMLEAARQRLNGTPNVELRRGTLEDLPIEDARLDAATLVLVLHHVSEPGAVLSSVARTLKPGGRLLVIDMLPHDRREYQQEMGHVWAGFSRKEIERQVGEAGFEMTGFGPLPPDTQARGPALFAASCRRAP